jgi:hypothetical protein
MRFRSVICAFCLAAGCMAQNIRLPESAVAGNVATISTTGTGKAVFYLAGPGVSRRNEIELGQDIRIESPLLQNTGIYFALICADTCHSGHFYLSAAKPASLIFLVHPSRVPVAQQNAISGVVFPVDQFRNLVLSPETVNFQLTAGNSSLFSHSNRTQDGVAWFRTTSGKSSAPVQVIASLDTLEARRAVQQVASDPCNLHITGLRTAKGILVETEPVHDCAGNPIPDGTIVSFTASGPDGKCTVDAPIKQGVARAQIAGSKATVVSVASGIVMGNELRIGAQP